MIVTFNDGKELVVESYSNNGDELWLNLYTDDYNGVKQLVYEADKSVVTVSKGKEDILTFDDYKDIAGFSSIVTETGRDYITIILKQSTVDIKELIAENERLVKENKELKNKVAKNK